MAGVFVRSFGTVTVGSQIVPRSETFTGVFVRLNQPEVVCRSYPTDRLRQDRSGTDRSDTRETGRNWTSYRFALDATIRPPFVIAHPGKPLSSCIIEDEDGLRRKHGARRDVTDEVRGAPADAKSRASPNPSP